MSGFVYESGKIKKIVLPENINLEELARKILISKGIEIDEDWLEINNYPLIQYLCDELPFKFYYNRKTGDLYEFLEFNRDDYGSFIDLEYNLDETISFKASYNNIGGGIETMLDEALENYTKYQITKEDLQKAFEAGQIFEKGEEKSCKTYNKYTGFQRQNEELNFEEWFEKEYKQKT